MWRVSTKECLFAFFWQFCSCMMLLWWLPEFFWLRLRSIQIFFKLEHEAWWKVVHLYWKWFQKLVFRYSYTYIKKADIFAFMLDTWKFHSYLCINKADICALDVYMEVSFIFVFLYLCIEKPDICALDRWKIHSWQTRVRRKWLGWRSVGGWREYNGGSHINCYSALPSII